MLILDGGELARWNEDQVRRLNIWIATCQPPAVFLILTPSDPRQEGLLTLKGVTHYVWSDQVSQQLTWSLAGLALKNRALTHTWHPLIPDLYGEAGLASGDRSEVAIACYLAECAEGCEAGLDAHVARVSAFCGILGTALGLNIPQVRQMRLGGYLHDIGKLAVPVTILNKPGQLNNSEWQVVKEHVVYGSRLIRQCDFSELRAVEDLVASHHERWDGFGYPNGLIGEQIPLSARICSVADVFDALTSRRPYKPALSTEEACGILRAGKGSQFQPMLVDTFLDSLPNILVAQRLLRNPRLRRQNVRASTTLRDIVPSNLS